MPEGAAGFWSYVRADDEADAGRITRLAQDLRDAYGLITSSELELFVDRDSLVWGDAWKERIDQAIAGTTFFIPIVTPRYFQSQECRRELLKFMAEARRLGLEQLVLPVYYVTVPELDHHPEDEVMALVAARQREDLREVRLAEPESGMYRSAIQRLAERIAEVASEVTRQPHEEVAAPPTPSPGAEGERGEGPPPEEEPPGVIERLAEAEEAMPRWGDTIEALGKEIQAVGELAEESAREMEERDSRGGGFAARLAVTERLAKRLKQPAQRIRELGRAYAADLVTIDPAMLTFFDELERDPSQAAELGEFLSGVHELNEQSRPAIASLRGMIQSFAEPARLSRSLRAPLNEIEQGLQGVLDGEAVIAEWDRRARELEALVADEDREGANADESRDDGAEGPPKTPNLANGNQENPS